MLRMMQHRFFFAFALLIGGVFLLLSFPDSARALALRNTPNHLGLVGYWTLNDGTGTKATDLSGNSNTGTLGGNASWVTGKKARALSFDGNGDYVDLGSSSTIRPTSLLSVSMWVKIAGDGAGSSPNMFISTQVGGSGWRVGYETSDDKIYFDLWDNGGNNTEARTTAAVSTGVWYHILAVYNGTATVALYLNGVSQTWVGGSNNGTIGDPAANPALGGYANSPGTYSFNGQLDDVRIYNRALSAADALLFYNAGLAVVKARDNKGLIGYWSFEDGTGTKATDFSGRGNTADVVNGTAWVQGKRGKGLSFDGNNDYVSVSNSTANISPSTGYTVAFWYNHTTTGRSSFLVLNNHTSGNATFRWIDDASGGAADILMKNDAGDQLFRIFPGSEKADGKWHHYAFTDTGGSWIFYVDGASVANNTYTLSGTFTFNSLAFSTDSTSFAINGALDDVRIYNRVLSPTEVANLYGEGSTANPTIKTVSRNGLVGYWSLDDGAGTKATDFSGNNRTADLTNMEAGDWVAGKRGKALSFDGVNERVVLPSNLFSSNVLTVSLWAKFNVIDSFQGLFSIYTSNGDQMEISVIDSNASIYGGNYTNRAISATNAISVGPWYHIALTSNGSVTQLYVNGVPSGTTGTTNFSTFNLAAYIGTDGNGTEHPFNGLIDDVRVYNRVLSAAEVQTLYTIGR